MGRRFQLALICLLWPIAHVGLAQAQSAAMPQRDSIKNDDLNYYLYQAFTAETPEQRLPLNHIGLVTELIDSTYVVSNLLTGYPAQEAGLRAGDRLISIDGSAFHPVWSFNPQDVPVTEFLPLPQTKELEFERNGVREKIRLWPVFENLFDSYRSATANSAQELSSGNKVVGYVKLWTLSRSTNDLVAFNELIGSLAHCDGIILDLRDSYGLPGLHHFDEFFPSRNSYFSVEGPLSKQWQPSIELRTNIDYYGKPLAVLQNQGTRGGMEIFTYQLSKLQRVVSVGGSTAGQLGNYVLDPASGEFIYQSAAGSKIDNIEFEATGISPEQAEAVDLSQSSATDPQFEAAFMTLMGII